VGERVKEILVLCNECRVPTYVPLEDDSYYSVVMPTFLAEGGDGFTMISDNVMSKQQSGKG
jgi:5'-nucleotidase